ncbi:MAG: hypothetical protein IPK74_36915 [Deltaproteobacteria bacterium]|nr:hypothetical protein [Deltaproteobacteria bacterium]
MSHGPHRNRWSARLSRLRKGGRDDGIAGEPPPVIERDRDRDRVRAERPGAAPPRSSAGGGWDHTSRPHAEPIVEAPSVPLRVQILSILADPRVEAITLETCLRIIARPRQDIETALDAMVQAGELVEVGGATKQYRVLPAEKERLEALFRGAAGELGEQTVLAEISHPDLSAYPDDDGDEPRLPVTAGLLSLFLPGTGQLLNGDVGRASLVFAVWSLAWITHLSPVWTFVCLYAGAEAFFTAKIRGMERKLAKDAIAGSNGSARALGP